MKKKTLKNIIRKHYTIKLIFPILIIAVCCAIIIISPHASAMRLRQLADPSYAEEVYNEGSRYVHITVDKLYYTGADLTLRNRLKGRVYYALKDDRIYYFVLNAKELPDDFKVLSNYDVKAALSFDHMDYNRIIDTMSRKLNFSVETIRALSSDIIFDQYYYTHSFSVFVSRSAFVIIIIALLHAVYIVAVLFKPHVSYSLLPLRYYGNAAELLNAAERDYAGTDECIAPSMYYTGTFIIILRKMSVDIIPLENVVWISRYNELHHTGHRNPHLQHPLCIVTDHKKVYKTPRLDVTTAARFIDTAQQDYPGIMIQ